MQQGSEGLSLEQALEIIRRRGLLIVLCVAIVAGAAYAYTKHQPKKYTATASVVFNNNQLSQQVAGLPVVSGDVPAQQASDLELVKLGDMAAETARILDHGLTEQKVASSLAIGAEGESSVVAVSATTGLPALSAAIANTYTRRFVAEQRRANRRYFRSALAVVNRQLAKLSKQQRLGPAGIELQDRAQTLSLLAELDYGGVQLAQEATAPTSPSSPRASRSTILAALVGLLIGVGLAFLLERLDRRIRTPEELEDIYNLPMLGMVPDSRALSKKPRPGESPAVLPPSDAEAFNLIRAHMRFFNVDHELRTVLIASAGIGDGKTTTARYLAEATARLGTRVLLLEMDLRHPTLATQLGIEPGPGLAEVLIGSVSMADAIRSIDLGASGGAGKEYRLDVLSACAMLPPNPGELLESRALDVVLERARSEYDFVVIDTPPLTAVSDAFPVLSKVEGVVIVGWIGRSRRDAAERLRQILTTSSAPLLGVIANGSKSNDSRAYAQPRNDKAPPAVASANGVASPNNAPGLARVGDASGIDAGIDAGI